MRGLDELATLLHGIDGRGYGGYKQIKGRWGDERLELVIDHVQGDPFASPSRVRIRLAPSLHGLPAELRGSVEGEIGLCNALLLAFGDAVAKRVSRTGSGRSGQVLLDLPRAEILARSACGFVGDHLELRFRVGLPANGRRILGRAAATLLTDDLPQAARTLNWEDLDHHELRRWVHVAEDHAHLQAQLGEHDLVAFVADGSILPRRTGVSSKPLEGAVPFESPVSMRVELRTKHHGPVTGMGIRRGVTLVTGGGFHGKTTLLEAIQFGIYPHAPGDGRERVATAIDAVKLRSEDGRAVTGVDLRPFIRDLPGDKDTSSFTTQDASGSTSLAASLLEALELGASVVLLDEDTSATNLLIRDARMQELIARETITPLIDRVRELHEQLRVSTILVVGGNGDYLEVADTVLSMEDYRPSEVTERARDVVRRMPTGRRTQDELSPLKVSHRRPDLSTLDPSRGSRRAKVRARGLRELSYGDDLIELSGLEQLVDDSQVRSIGVLLRWLSNHGEPEATLAQLLPALQGVARGLVSYELEPLPELAGVRPLEVIGALNRLRSLGLLS